MGGIKQLTETTSFQRPYNNQILSADAVYQFCSKNTLNILFNFIERDTLNLLWDKWACQHENGEMRLDINVWLMAMTWQVL